jgi:molybdate transport system substrate-binding protein
MKSLIVAAGSLLCTITAQAADLKVLSLPPLRAVLSEQMPQFEKAFGHKVTVEYGTPPQLAERFNDAVDVVMATEQAIASFQRDGKVARGHTEIARVGMAVFVRAGAPKPDVSTVEAFKRTLTAAKSIAYIDPASGAPGGIYLATLFDQFGIAGVLAPKTKLLGPSGAEKAVATGDVELGLSQKTIILASPGVELVAPLPADIQNYLTFVATVATGSKNPDAAKALIDSVASSRPALRAKGYD